MVDQAQFRIQEAMTSLVNDLDKSVLRSMQKIMHLCSAKCCENRESPLGDVHKCIENCSTSLNQTQTYIQNELSQFQDRLQRCVMVCQDNVKEKVTASTTEAQAGVYKKEFEDCAMRCVDDHIALIPSMKKRLLTQIVPNS